MKLNNLFSLLENGATHILLYDNETGKVFLKTIWYNQVPQEMLNWKVKKLTVLDYELRVGISEK